MVRGKGTSGKQYLSQSELEALQDEKRELQVALNEIKGGTGVGTAGSAVDISKIERDIKRVDEVIEQGKAPEARGRAKDDLVEEERELELAIAAGMPTVHEMRKPAANPGAVRKHMQWGERNFSNIKRYVEIQKILRPLEPKSIENLRRER